VDTGECPQWVDAVVDGRDSLHDFLLERGIETRKFWHPIHTQAPYKMTDRGFENAIEVSAHALWLPSALTLKEADTALICDRIREWARSSV
jgi:dTDP-4-amino-4,6-dideoxygalactose transaminase